MAKLKLRGELSILGVVVCNWQYKVCLAAKRAILKLKTRSQGQLPYLPSAYRALRLDVQGATTFRIMTLSITTLIIITFSKAIN
jgi:hypothetical protein